MRAIWRLRPWHAHRPLPEVILKCGLCVCQSLNRQMAHISFLVLYRWRLLLNKLLYKLKLTVTKILFKMRPLSTDRAILIFVLSHPLQTKSHISKLPDFVSIQVIKSQTFWRRCRGSTSSYRTPVHRSDCRGWGGIQMYRQRSTTSSTRVDQGGRTT